MGVNEFTNAEKYKGNDIDTDGDGSVNDAQTVQGNAPSDLGNTIDGTSITENANGEIQADPSIRGKGWNKLIEDSSTSLQASHTFNISTQYDEYLITAKIEAGSNTIVPRIRVNGDSGSNYNYTNYNGNSTTGSNRWEDLGTINSNQENYVVFAISEHSEGLSIHQKGFPSQQEGNGLLAQGLNQNVGPPLSSITFVSPFGNNMKINKIEIKGYNL